MSRGSGDRGCRIEWTKFETWFLFPAGVIVRAVDIPSRGLATPELSVSQLWRSGPNCLEMTCSPESVLLPEAVPESCIPEMKAADRKVAHNLLSTTELISE